MARFTELPNAVQLMVALTLLCGALVIVSLVPIPVIVQVSATCSADAVSPCADSLTVEWVQLHRMFVQLW